MVSVLLGVLLLVVVGGAVGHDAAEAGADAVSDDDEQDEGMSDSAKKLTKTVMLALQSKSAVVRIAKTASDAAPSHKKWMEHKAIKAEIDNLKQVRDFHHQ